MYTVLLRGRDKTAMFPYSCLLEIYKGKEVVGLGVWGLLGMLGSEGCGNLGMWGPEGVGM